MDEKTITLKGHWAVIALLGIGAFTAFQYSHSEMTLQSDAVEVIKTWLVAEYTRNALPQLQELVDNPSGKEKQIEALVNRISRDNLHIVSIESRGNGEDVAVKVEIEIDGKNPPDGKRTRYFRMSHSTLIGWQYQHEIGKWGYYLTY